MGLGIKMDALSVKQNGAFVQIDKFLFQRLHPGAGQFDDESGQIIRLQISLPKIDSRNAAKQVQ